MMEQLPATEKSVCGGHVLKKSLLAFSEDILLPATGNQGISDIPLGRS